MPANPISISGTFLYLSIFVTLILGIMYQGGDFFWFGLAAASSIMLFLFYFNQSYKQPLLLPKSSINLLFLLFSGWCFLTVMWSVVPHISLLKSITIASAPIGIYSYFVLTRSAIKWQQLWRIVIAAGLVLFVYSIIEVYLGISAPNSLFFNKNTHSAYLNLIILPTSAYFILADSSRARKILGASLFLLIYSQALPGSRGASLGLFIGLGMMLYAGRKNITRSYLKQVLGIYTGAIALATLTTSNLLRFFKYDLKDADVGRWEIWEGAINLLKDTPWYGSGVGTYWLTHPAYRHINDPSSGQNAHNDYLQYLIEAGVPGLILLLLIVGSILFFWWKYQKSTDVSSAAKIEVSAIIGAITAVGFHAFFTFNMEVFCILYLTGLLLGRLFFVSGQTRNTSFLGQLNIRKPIFSFSSAVFALILFISFLGISAYSQLYVRAAQSYIEGNITKADRLNSIALSIYPNDDRPYLLYAYIYEEILDKVSELDDNKRRFYFQEAMNYLEKARQINPYRAKNYLLKGRIFESNPDLAGSGQENNIEALYIKSLKVNPRYSDAAIQLADYYTRKGDGIKASETVYNFIKYWQPANKKTLEIYSTLEPIVLKAQIESHLLLFRENKKMLKEAIDRKEINISNNTLF